MLRVWYPGQVLGQGSMRSFIHAKTGKVVSLHAKAAFPAWRDGLRLAMLQVHNRPKNAPFSVSISAFVRRPDGHWTQKRELSREGLRNPFPQRSGVDLDKVQRAVGDAGEGVWWQNDRHIVQWNMVERLWEGDDGPGLLVTAYPLGGDA